MSMDLRHSAKKIGVEKSDNSHVIPSRLNHTFSKIILLNLFYEIRPCYMLARRQKRFVWKEFWLQELLNFIVWRCESSHLLVWPQFIVYCSLEVLEYNPYIPDLSHFPLSIWQISLTTSISNSHKGPYFIYRVIIFWLETFNSFKLKPKYKKKML